MRKEIKKEIRYCLFCGKVLQGQHTKYCNRKCRYSDPVQIQKLKEAGFGSRFSRGFHPSEEIKQKMSKARLGDKNPNYGKHPSKETRQKLREANLGKNHPMYGKHQSSETRKKRSESLKGKKNPMYGKHHSAETKLKERKSHLGSKNSFFGKHHTEETKQKIRIKKQDRKFPFLNTKIEIACQDYLRSIKVEFETQKLIFGHPDIYIPKQKIIIFCDGDYWHANPKKYKASRFMYYPKGMSKTAQKVWDYDKKITGELEKQGYIVLRFWEYDINHNFEKVKEKILEVLSLEEVR
jgi:DNA mismatch endonuclease Vsr